MIYGIQTLIVLLVVLALSAEGFKVQSSRMNISPLSMALSDYKKELAATAAALTAPGKGILAVDESTKTVGKRLESIGMTNSEEARQAWRGLLFTAPGLCLLCCCSPYSNLTKPDLKKIIFNPIPFYCELYSTISFPSFF